MITLSLSNMKIKVEVIAHEESYVDKNYINRNGDGYNFCKVKVRAHRVPNIRR